MKPEPMRTCRVCGAAISTDNDACPVCALRGALDEDHVTNALAAEPSPSTTQFRFGHYTVLQNADGKPFELGRGAMGVTYKAFDVDLKCPVALKVITARYLGDESARLRFIREARAAASVRHPNVASVFHLGKSGDSYFYAMEFVEGEPLNRILRYRGPLAVGLALDILDQVAAALSAAYRQNLVHRDIKPANLMVSFAEGGRTTVKVIDFGLARPIRSSAAELRLSEAGAFIGTPHFASPEQCSGKEADIRSDLYSLGVTFWMMLTGKVPFEGSTALEVIEKHQHETPLLERLEHVPRPIVSLIASLLQKDPAQRPQTPFQLQSMIREVREAVETDKSHLGPPRDRITRRAFGSRRGALLELS